MKQNMPVFAIVFASTVLSAIAGFVTTYFIFGGFNAVHETGRAAQKPETVSKNQSGIDKLVTHNAPRPLPDIKFTDAEGKERHLSEWRGRMVLINLWATWCAPCKAEMPSLDRLQAKLGGEDFSIVTLSLDSGGINLPRQFFQTNNIKNLELFLADIGEVGQKLQMSGVPTTIIIDREGREIARLAGTAEWDTPDVVTRISDFIQRGKS